MQRQYCWWQSNTNTQHCSSKRQCKTIQIRDYCIKSSNLKRCMYASTKVRRRQPFLFSKWLSNVCMNSNMTHSAPVNQYHHSINTTTREICLLKTFAELETVFILSTVYHTNMLHCGSNCPLLWKIDGHILHHHSTISLLQTNSSDNTAQQRRPQLWVTIAVICQWTHTTSYHQHFLLNCQ